MNAQPAYSDPSARAIWDAYVDAVQPAQQAYAEAITAAQAIREAAEAEVDNQRRTVRHSAWEAQTEAITQAWKRYMLDTAAARDDRERQLNELAQRTVFGTLDAAHKVAEAFTGSGQAGSQ